MIQVCKPAAHWIVAILAATAMFSSAGRGQVAPGKRPSPVVPKTESEAPVKLGEQVLFHVRTRVFSFSPGERAQAIAAKIQRLARDPRAANAITVTDAETTTEIASSDTVIMTVTDSDALAEGKSRTALAAEYSQKIRQAIVEERNTYNWKTVALGVLWTLLATVVFLGVASLIRLLSPKIYGRVESWRASRIPALRIQELELVSASRIADVLLLVMRAVHRVVFLALLYLYVSSALSFFPWTRGYASALWDYMVPPVRAVGDAVVSYLPNVLLVAVVLCIAYYAIRFVNFLFQEIGKGTITLPNFYPDWAEPTYKIVRFLILAFTAVIVFPYLPGSKSPAFQGISIFLGLLVSLGSTNAVGNIVAGVLLTYTRAFQVGDRVQIGDATGDVLEKTLLVTRLRTIKNEDISIPNTMVFSSHTTNFSSSAQEHGLILHTSVTIGYDAPWKTVHQLLIAAALATDNILKDPAPFVLQTSLDDFYVTYQINVYTREPRTMAGIYSNLHQNIQDRFNEAGVEIMSPHYKALRDGNQVAIPESYLADGDKTPSFRIRDLGKS